MAETLFWWLFAVALGFGVFLGGPMARAIFRKCLATGRHRKVRQSPSTPPPPKSPDPGGNGHDGSAPPVRASTYLLLPAHIGWWENPGRSEGGAIVIRLYLPFFLALLILVLRRGGEVT